MLWQAKTAICVALLTAATNVAAKTTPYRATGMASWYGNELRGQKTANGERFNPDGITAAHRSLPLASYAEVTSLDTGKTIIVRVNDRGPYHGGRLIDLSLGAARQLGITGNGSRLVHVRAVSPPEVERDLLRRGMPVAARARLSAVELATLRDRSKWNAPVQTRAVIPAGQGPYFIQVATFSAKHRADIMAAALGGSVYTFGATHRVRLGPYGNAKSVNAALAPLAAKGYPDVRIVR
jgi:rare lipoprotein A